MSPGELKILSEDFLCFPWLVHISLLMISLLLSLCSDIKKDNMAHMIRGTVYIIRFKSQRCTVTCWALLVVLSATLKAEMRCLFLC